MNADVHALTGAYALDALTDAERNEFEAHLAECESCLVEVTELRKTATRLAAAAAGDPPARLKAGVLARIGEVRQDGPGEVLVLARRGGARRVFGRLTAAAAAVLLVVAAALGVLLARERGATQDAERQATAMSSLLRAGDVAVARQSGVDGQLTVVYSRERNRVMIFAADLAPPPRGHDYQAWAIGDDITSAGLLRPNDGAAVAESSLGAASAIGVTVEPAGGSRQPTTPPVMRINLPEEN